MRSAIISDLPILDLRNISPNELSRVAAVQNVRTVILDQQNAEAFLNVARVNVRSHLIMEADERLVIDQIEFTNDYLSSLASNTKLVVLGHLLVDSFDPQLFFHKVSTLRLFGQVLCSDLNSAGALLSRVKRWQGQLLMMPADSIRWIGRTLITPDLLDHIDNRSVVSIGPITISADVLPDTITNKIRTMVQIGEVIGSEEAVSALFSICTRRLGSYNLSQPQTPPQLRIINPEVQRA